MPRRRNSANTRCRHRVLIDSLEPRQLLSTTIYVDASSPGPTHNGSSWSAAYTDLQLALSSATPGDTIKVAQGTYKPTTTMTRTISFRLKNGVSLYGGYAGDGAPDPDVRDVDAHPTVLSGDIGTPGDIADNSYHVLVADGVDATAVLDGVTVTGGNADGADAQHDSVGGGLRDTSASPTLRDCTFRGNFAGSGGAVYNYGSQAYNYAPSAPTLVGCTFAGNVAVSHDGGAVYDDFGSAPTLAGCAFVGNAAPTGGGGAIYDDFSSPVLADCTFAGNVGGGGGIGSAIVDKFNNRSTLTNCVIWGTGPGDTPYYQTDGSEATVTYSDVQGGHAGTGNIDADPRFTRIPSPGPDAKWGTPDDDYGDLRLSAASPCVDAGNNAAVPPALTTDLGGQPRFVDIPAVPDAGLGPAPVVDMGAYEAAPALAADAGGPYVVLAGGAMTLHGRGAAAAAGPVTYAWDWNGDGRFDEATGADVPFPVGSFAPGSVVTPSLRVTDGSGHSTVDTSSLRIAPATVYVDARAGGGRGTGLSWADAYTDLAAALRQAVSGQVVRVAGGMYLPTGTGDRTATFRLDSGVRLYGGYAGSGAPDPNARDLVAHPTVLSGDLGTAGDVSDDSYHVVMCLGADAGTLLDGVTVTGGNADGPQSLDETIGGGMLIHASTLALVDCTFRGNAGGSGLANEEGSDATLSGCTFQGNGPEGGMWNYSSDATLTDCTFQDNVGGGLSAAFGTTTLTRCTFVGNSTDGVGGGMDNGGEATLTDCTFERNTAYDGGGLDSSGYYGTMTLTRCTFDGNDAEDVGGGAYFDMSNGSATVLTDCVFTGNGSSNTFEGGGLYGWGDRSTLSLTRCTFTGNSANYAGGGMYFLFASCDLSGCTFDRNSSGFYGGGLYIDSDATAALTGCAFRGNVASDSGGGMGNASDATLANCTFVGNVAVDGTGGGMDNEDATASLTNCTFAGNAAATLGGGLGSVWRSSVTLANCVLRGDSAPTGPEVGTDADSMTTVTYSNVQGGYPGTANLSADPLFYRNPSPGPDSTWGTPDNDYGDLRLLPSSPCLDAGSNAALPAGTTTDLAGHPRITDFPGSGPANSAVVDMGAYESSTDLGDLHITPGRTVTLPPGGYAFTATQLIVDPGGTLDVADDSLLITYAGPSPLPAIRSALASGYHNGTWTGTGITSSAARSAPHRAVGYAEAASLGLTTFAGRPIDGPALLLKYTLAGDATLDGRLDADDFALADRGKARGTFDNWVHGDFNYDAAVTDADLAILTAAFAPPPTPAPVATTATAPDEQPAVVPVTAAVLSAENPAPAPAAQQPVTPAIPPHHAKHAKHHLAKAKKPKHPHLVQSQHKKAKSPPHAAIHHKNASRAIHSSHPHSAR